ncbi:hypothetical protein L3i23_00470 [Herbiconiux sp. L3-i23]|nr:hypothetical protein L3i23_00470 [Herbiconiux sp. L3-i23]
MFAFGGRHDDGERPEFAVLSREFSGFEYLVHLAVDEVERGQFTGGARVQEEPVLRRSSDEPGVGRLDDAHSHGDLSRVGTRCGARRALRR